MVIILKCTVCDSIAQPYSALHKIKVGNNMTLVCEECLPGLFAGCSKLVMEKSISGAYAADNIIGVQKRIEHIIRNHEESEEKSDDSGVKVEVKVVNAKTKGKVNKNTKGKKRKKTR